MPYATVATRTKTGTVADADPNTSAPAAADELTFSPFHPATNEKASGWVYYLVYLDAGGAEVSDGDATVTLWVKDAADGSWASVAADAAVGNRELFQLQHLFAACTLFAQLTGITGTAIATIEVRLGSF